MSDENFNYRNSIIEFWITGPDLTWGRSLGQPKFHLSGNPDRPGPSPWSGPNIIPKNLVYCRLFHSKLTFCKLITANCKTITANNKLITAKRLFAVKRSAIWTFSTQRGNKSTLDDVCISVREKMGQNQIYTDL